jgi:hypothetical protein
MAKVEASSTGGKITIDGTECSLRERVFISPIATSGMGKTYPSLSSFSLIGVNETHYEKLVNLVLSGKLVSGSLEANDVDGDTSNKKYEFTKTRVLTADQDGQQPTSVYISLDYGSLKYPFSSKPWEADDFNSRK